MWGRLKKSGIRQTWWATFTPQHHSLFSEICGFISHFFLILFLSLPPYFFSQVLIPDKILHSELHLNTICQPSGTWRTGIKCSFKVFLFSLFYFLHLLCLILSCLYLFFLTSCFLNYLIFFYIFHGCSRTIRNVWLTYQVSRSNVGYLLNAGNFKHLVLLILLPTYIIWCYLF